MGFLDKLKNAVNVVTGGAAKVELEMGNSFMFPGDEISVTIRATSTGGEVKSAGAYIDLNAVESVKFVDEKTKQEVSTSRVTMQQTFQIAPAFTLGPNESRTFEGKFRLPPQVLPSYQGSFARHECQIRGRIEAFGNDPDSGFVPVRIGAKS